MRTKVGLLLIGLLAVMIFPIYASAATLDVVGGQLMGADGVDVGGVWYDVAFVDGTCVDLFGGCDESGDFVFTTPADALLASQALLDQVFLDGLLGSFDSEPSLTNGIEALYEGAAITAYAQNSTLFGQIVGVGFAVNAQDNSLDGLALSEILATTDMSINDAATWAVWSPGAAPVPEPSTLLLLGSGLAGLAFIHRKRKIK